MNTKKWKKAVDDEFEKLLTITELSNKSGKYLIRKIEGVENWSKTRKLVHPFHKTDFYTIEHILPQNSSAFSRQEGIHWKEHKEHGSWEDPDGERLPQQIYRRWHFR